MEKSTGPRGNLITFPTSLLPAKLNIPRVHIFFRISLFLSTFCFLRAVQQLMLANCQE